MQLLTRKSLITKSILLLDQWVLCMATIENALCGRPVSVHNELCVTYAWWPWPLTSWPKKTRESRVSRENLRCRLKLSIGLAPLESDVQAGQTEGGSKNRNPRNPRNPSQFTKSNLFNRPYRFWNLLKSTKSAANIITTAYMDCWWDWSRLKFKF